MKIPHLFITLLAMAASCGLAYAQHERQTSGTALNVPGYSPVRQDRNPEAGPEFRDRVCGVAVQSTQRTTKLTSQAGVPLPRLCASANRAIAKWK